MHVLQSNGYIFEDSLILFQEMLHLIERCLVCERRLLFAYMESSIRTYPGLSKTLYLACKTR